MTSLTNLLVFLKSFLKLMLRRIDKALQESLLPLCADVSVKKGVDELVFIYLDKV